MCINVFDVIIRTGTISAITGGWIGAPGAHAARRVAGERRADPASGGVTALLGTYSIELFLEFIDFKSFGERN